MEKENKLQKSDNQKSCQLYIKNSIQRVQSNDIATIKENGLQLSKLKKDQPQDLLIAVAAMIESVYQLVNVGKQITGDAIVTLSTMIIENYWYMKIDELDIVFKRGIMGKYGKIYDRVDASVIFDWLHKYDISDECIDLYETKVADYKKREHDSSILNVAEFRERIKAIPGAAESPEDDKANEEHREDVRAQAKKMMEDNEPVKGDSLRK